MLARYATAGTGLYKGSIDWFEWGTAGQVIPAGGLTRTNTSVVAGQTLATTCTVGAPSGGTLIAYRSGTFSGDGLDNMYNVGGAGASNTMVAGLANQTLGDQISFHISCSVTLNGVSVPLAGLVMADAEASDQATNEFVQATIPAGGDWRLIDRYRAGCALSTPATRTGQTLRLGGVVPGCTTYPTTVAFMEDATSANVVVHGGGRSAVALGVMLFSDFGDAPASYGDAGALYSPSFSGGLFPQGTSSVFTMGMGTPGQPATRLGASVDAESAEQPSANAGADALDDGVTPPSTIGVRAGDPYTLPTVACTGPGFVNGWIDWNGNGVFDAGEASGSAQCVGGAATLNWTVPGDVQAGATFLRLRIGPTAASVTGPTGMTTAGEVEDYAVAVAIPAPFSCGTNAPGLLFQSPGPTLTNRYAIDLVTGTYPTPQQIADRQLNAVGYNTQDNFVYGWDVASDQVVRVGSDGTVQDLGAPAGMSAAMVDLGFAVGDVDDNNHYWVSRTDTGQWFEIDLATNTVIASGTALSSVNASGVDWAYLAGTNKLWRVASDAAGTASFLTGFDRTTHTWTTPVALGDVSDNLTGAIFADAAGFLYSSFNNTGDIWRIDPVAGTATKFSDGPAAPGNDGARCADSPILIDFGDAPNGYLTNLGVDGPRHGIPGYDAADKTAPLMLGSTIDPENNGQPGAGASGDGSDEDGVAGPITIPVGGSGTITVSATNNTNQVATLAGWVDLNDNGTFEASERVTVPVPANSGTASYDLTFPAVTGTDTYARFRLFPGTVAAPLPTGPASAGEVEDYPVTVTPPTPFTCGTNAPGLLFQSTGPTLTNVYPVDLVTGTYPAPSAIPNRQLNAVGYNTADDYLYAWDVASDQVVRIGADGGVQNLGAPVGIPAAVADVGFVVGDVDDDNHYWITVPSTGAWYEIDLADNTVVASGTSLSSVPANGFDWAYVPGTNKLWRLASDAGGTTSYLTGFDRTTHTWTAPVALGDISDNLTGALFADAAGFLYASYNNTGEIWRIDTTGGTATKFADGPASTGNDGARCVNSAILIDLGDAPNSYKTTLAADGPRHGIPGYDDATGTAPLMLGATIDPEDDGQPGSGANGDGSDEDGVAAPITMTTGDPVTVTVSATNNTNQVATLAGWIDLNGDGTFQAGERVTATVPANSGTGSYQLTFPAGTTTSDTYARFRLFPGTVASPLPTGPASAGEVEDYPVTLLSRELDIEKSSNATADSRPGDTITYTVTATNTGNGDFTAANPARVRDSLAGVLDDATYNNDAAASTGPDPTYAQPVIAWTGALDAGDSVTITYTVTLKGGGDGRVRNVAFAQCDPADTDCDPAVPVCDPPNGDGLDPATGKPCAESELLLPKLTIVKAADRTDLPAVGQTVTYTVTVKNAGPGDTTAAEPATFTDDLSDVLDANTSDPSGITASVGSASFTIPKISWSGVLAAGDSATISYTVTYLGGGDQQLTNNACVPVAAAQDPQDPCANVQIPGSGLDHDKVSSPASGTPVEVGQVITYTLRFTNTGPIPAAVDTFDDLTGVLDDADVVPGSVDADAGLVATYDAGNQRIDVTGTVPVGQSLEVTYQVKVKAFADQGDHLLRNALQCEPGDPLPCAPEETEHPVRALDIAKTSDRTAATVVGDTVTYTVKATNTGEAAYTATDPALVRDSLAGVLDDGDYNGDAQADLSGSLTYNAPVIRWEGALGVGQTVTITYTVMLKSGGDLDVRNVAWGGPGTAPECDPPTADGVDSDTGQPCAVSDFGLPRIVDSKSVDPDDGTAVKAGDELTYSLTFSNTGTAAGAVSKDDYVGMLLDDATITDGPSVSDPALTATVNGNRIEVRGTLAAGQSVTVTYTATVKSDADRVADGGDDELGNFLIDPSDTPPTQCLPEADEDSTCNPVARIVDSKSVDPKDGTAVKAGDELTYTLTFDNLGKGAGDVTRDDYVGMLLDDATITDGPDVSDPALTATVNGNRIEVRGTLAAGQTVTVTYTITVKSDADRVADGGDDELGNFLIDPSDTPPTQCLPEADEDSTCNPVGRIVDSKSVDPADGTAVNAGDELTYTLTFSNLGKGAGDVTRDDYVGMLLDDATITDGPSSSDPALTATVNGNRIEVRGTLAGGQTVTVTYTVTVKSDADRVADGGDDQVGNFLIGPDATPPTECAPTADQDATCNPVSRIVDSKSVDPKDGTTVHAGDALTYTLTFANLGKGAGEVSRDDYLGMLLDDAAITGGPDVSAPALTATVNGDRIEVRGVLEGGQTVTVTYTVTVKPKGGDYQLGNFLIDPDATPPTECAPTADEDATCNPVPHLVDSKSVSPESGTAVGAGEQLTYTLTFANEGKASGEVDRVDDLSKVLDDAELVDGPHVSDPALTVTGPTDGKLAVTGTLAAGQQVLVTYTVRVKPRAEQGDQELGNWLLDPDEKPPAECEPSEDSTCNPVSDVVATKSVDPDDGSEVEPGQVLTYTLTFTNEGKGAGKVDYVDKMAGILDDATLVSGPDSSDPALVASGGDDGKIKVTGTLGSGSTVTVSYAVKVKAYADQGDHHLANFLVAPGVLPPTCLPDDPMCTENDVASPESVLPGTGGPSRTPLALGLLMVMVGCALVWRSRDRRRYDRVH